MNAQTGSNIITNKVKRNIFILISMLLGIMFSLCIVEISLHLLWKSPWLPVPIGFLRNDPDTYIMHTSNFRGVLNTPYYRVPFCTNSHGLRDLERTYAKPEGTFRILALGDSYVEGQGVEFEKIFLRQAELQLNKKHERPAVQIIKAGVGGWGPVNELNYLKHEGYKYSPDVVMVNFFVGNDYIDAASPGQFVVYRGLRIEKDLLKSMNTMTDIRISLRKHVFLYGLIVDMVKSFSMNNSQRYSEDYSMLTFFRDANHPQIVATQNAVNEFYRWSRERNIPLHFVILPHRTQVDVKRAEKVAEMFNLKWNDIDLDRPSHWIISMLKAKGIPYFDATTLLRQKANEGRTIGLGGDSHYNSEIHGVLGIALSEYINDSILKMPTKRKWREGERFP